MPELPEVEAYRRLAESRALGRVVDGVVANDAWYLKRGLSADAVADVLRGQRFVAARRRGKLLLLDTDGGEVVGLRFGMSGRLMVDGLAGVGQLIYSPPDASDTGRWDRFAVRFSDGGTLVMRDARRLGGVELDPDEDRLGPDALTITLAALTAALAKSAAPLKARLMDQSRVAGVGNLIADEVLWRAKLSPQRPAGGLTAAERRRLHHHLRRTVQEFIDAGGSHTGRLMPVRGPGGRCPRDGTELVRATVGGRTTFWCPQDQT